MRMQMSTGSMVRMMMVAIGAGTLFAPGLYMPTLAQAADPEMKIEVTITDQGYNVKGHTMPGLLTAIVVRNQGSMTHGFASPLFKEAILRKEGGGVEIRGPKGKGFRSYHLDAGQTMTLYFKKESPVDPATGGTDTIQVPFWCDIHPHMKGEFLVVETTGEIGGG
jgi:hypothetical protein